MAKSLSAYLKDQTNDQPTSPMSVRIPRKLREEIEVHMKKNKLRWRTVIVAALEQYREEIVGKK